MCGRFTLTLTPEMLAQVLRRIWDYCKSLEGEVALWLDRTIADPGKLKPLYQPYPAELMEMWPISPLVNSPRNDSPDCIKRVVL